MMSIQVGYNKNYHKKVHWVLGEVWYLIIVLRYEDSDIRVMLVELLWNWEMLVLKLVIPVACTYGEPLCDEVRAWGICRVSSFVWRSGARDG